MYEPPGFENLYDDEYMPGFPKDEPGDSVIFRKVRADEEFCRVLGMTEGLEPGGLAYFYYSPASGRSKMHALSGPIEYHAEHNLIFFPEPRCGPRVWRVASADAERVLAALEDIAGQTARRI